MDWSRDGGLKNQILIVDGLSGTGKSMLSKVLGSLNGFATPRFFYPLEWALQGVSDNAMRKDFFDAWFSLLTDQLTYDYQISREVNFRPSDMSSVLRSPGALRALLKLMRPDGPGVLGAGVGGLSLITHQSFGGFEAVRQASGTRLLWLEIVRRPADLVTHWASYIERYGTGSSEFTLAKSFDEAPVPWFVDEPKAFLTGSSATKTLLSLVSLYSKLNRFEEEVEQSENVIFIPFEKFVVGPHDYLAQIGKAASSTFGPALKRILRSEGIPRSPGPNDQRFKPRRYRITESAQFLIDQAPRSLREQFLRIDEHYVTRHGVDSF